MNNKLPLFIRNTTATCGRIITTRFLSRKKKQQIIHHKGGPNTTTNLMAVVPEPKDTIMSNYHDAMVTRRRCEEEEDDGDSLTSTLFLPDEEEDGYSTSSGDSVISKENGIKEHQDDYTQQKVVYSTLYIKLPNGNWLVHYRTKDEQILSSYELKSYMI